MTDLQEPSPAAEVVASREGSQSDQSVLSGWLILPSIGLVLGPVIWLTRIFESREALNANPMLRTEMKTYLEFAIWWGKAFLIFQLLVAFLFFFRSKMAPAAIITLLVANIILACLSAAKAHALNPAYDVSLTCTPAFVSAGIWIPYFVLSKRVKQTFAD